MITLSNPFGEVGGEWTFVGAQFADTEEQSAKELVEEIQQYCYERGVLVWSAGRRGGVHRGRR